MNHSCTCLTPKQLRDLTVDDLPPQRWTELEEHLTHCDGCRAALDNLDADLSWQGEVRGALREGLAPDGSRIASFSQFEEALPNASSALQGMLALLGPTDDPRMLGRIGPYEIVGLLGRGGMGVVFKGFDAALNRYVAIKMLLPHLATSDAARKRFAREAQAAAAVVHEHVMAIHSVAEWQGTPFLVMPYGRGESLQKRLDEKGALKIAEVLRIGMQTARALAAAHAQGLVHRDVKPANILLEEGVERVKLTDFGLARAVDDIGLTRIGVLAGTPQFMSPEQALGRTVDGRSDLFSLGSVLYAMGTGHAPFRADSTFGVLRQITEEPPRSMRQINPATPEWLEQIVRKLLAKSPADRFATAAEVAAILEGCLAHLQQPAVVPLPRFCESPPATVWSHLRLRLGRHRRHVATVLITATVMIAGGYPLIHKRPEQIAEQQVETQNKDIDSDALLEWNAIQDHLDSITTAIQSFGAAEQHPSADSQSAETQKDSP